MNRKQRRAKEAIERKPSKAGAGPRRGGRPGKSTTLKSGRGRLSVK